MIEFFTQDGKYWKTPLKEFNLALESIKAWPVQVGMMTPDDCWFVYNRAIIGWRELDH